MLKIPQKKEKRKEKKKKKKVGRKCFNSHRLRVQGFFVFSVFRVLAGAVKKYIQEIIEDLIAMFLGVFSTLDHEVVSRPCKICDWLLNSS